MCFPEMLDAKTAATKLARLMERQLGYVEGHIDSVALRLLITAYWSRVSALAHAIHDGADDIDAVRIKDPGATHGTTGVSVAKGHAGDHSAYSGAAQTMNCKPAPPTHKAAPRRPVSVCLFALPQGGFLVRDPMWAQDYRDVAGNMVRTHDSAAFSTLEEALDWLRVNMARPAEDNLPA